MIAAVMAWLVRPLADLVDLAFNVMYPQTQVQRAHIEAAAAFPPRSDVVGCGQCTERPFAIGFPSGTTRIICDQHGQVARVKPQN